MGSRAPKRLHRQMKYAMQCSVRGCKREAIVRGLCKEHYRVAWRKANPNYDRDHWRSHHWNSVRACPLRITNNGDPILPAIARERRLLVRLKRKFSIPYRLPLQLQTLTPEQIVREWWTFI